MWSSRPVTSSRFFVIFSCLIVQCYCVSNVTGVDNSNGESNLVEVKVKPPDGFLISQNLHENPEEGDRVEIRTLVTISEELHEHDEKDILAEVEDAQPSEQNGVIVSIKKSDEPNKYIIKKKRRLLPKEDAITFMPTPLPLLRADDVSKTFTDETDYGTTEGLKPIVEEIHSYEKRAEMSKDITITNEMLDMPTPPPLKISKEVTKVDHGEKMHKNENDTMIDNIQPRSLFSSEKDIGEKDDHYKSRALRIFPKKVAKRKRIVVTRPRKTTSKIVVKPIRPQPPAKVRLYYGNNNKRRRQIQKEQPPLRINNSVHEYVVKVAENNQQAFIPHPHLGESKQIIVDQHPSNIDFLSNFHSEYGTKLTAAKPEYVTSRPLNVNYVSNDDDIWHPIHVSISTTAKPVDISPVQPKSTLSTLTSNNDNIANLLVKDPYQDYVDIYEERLFDISRDKSEEEEIQPGPPYQTSYAQTYHRQPILPSFFNREYFDSDFGPSKRSRSLSVIGDDSVEFGGSAGENGAFEWFSHHPVQEAAEPYYKT